jgi:hypothetical protein
MLRQIAPFASQFGMILDSKFGAKTPQPDFHA